MAKVWSEQTADQAPDTPSALSSPPDILVPPAMAPQGGRDVLAAIAADAGLHRIHFVAWRDLDDPEAGGSELHAHRIATALGRGRYRRDRCRTSAVPNGAGVHRAGRLPGGPAGRAVRGLPAVASGRPPRPPTPGRRTGRDLERHAVLLAAVVPGPADRLPPPRPRRDVADGPARPGWPGRGDDRRAPVGAAALPAEPGRHPVRVVHAARSSTCCACPRTGSRWPRRASSPGSRPARPSARRCRSSSPSAGWCR